MPPVDFPCDLFSVAYQGTMYARFVHGALQGLATLLVFVEHDVRTRHGGVDHEFTSLCVPCVTEAHDLILTKLGPDVLKSACCSLCLERLVVKARAAEVPYFATTEFAEKLTDHFTSAARAAIASQKTGDES